MKCLLTYVRYFKDYKMNNFFVFLGLVTLYVLTFSVSGCVTIDDQQIRYFTTVENQSENSVEVFTYDAIAQPPIDSITIEPGERKDICSYLEFGYAGFGCTIGRVEYVFPNDKGYNCIKGRDGNNESPECFFNGKDPFRAPRLPDNGNGTLLIITQEDFLMAREL